ncbi:MAG TPA: hypothetical protein VJQ43_03685, partial [Thermoplasmata archaeon]|nr:hypothetical protein [Thermoplasmata archaeon]
DPPTSETELLLRRPTAFRQDAFPRQWLLADERVLYETRPGLLSRYWGRLTIASLWALLWIGAGTQPGVASQASYWGVAGFLAIPPLLWIFLGWRGRAIALTDRRVLATKGAVSRTLESATYDEVQRLTVGSSSTDDITFHLGAAGAVGRRAAASGRPSKLVWPDVQMAQQVYQYVQDAFRLESVLSAQRATRTAFVQAALRTRIPCSYCGRLIEFDPNEGGADPVCPQCGAPIRLSMTE